MEMLDFDNETWGIAYPTDIEPTTLMWFVAADYAFTGLSVEQQTKLYDDWNFNQRIVCTLRRQWDRAHENAETLYQRCYRRILYGLSVVSGVGRAFSSALLPLVISAYCMIILYYTGKAFCWNPKGTSGPYGETGVARSRNAATAVGKVGPHTPITTSDPNSFLSINMVSKSLFQAVIGGDTFQILRVKGFYYLAPWHAFAIPMSRDKEIKITIYVVTTYRKEPDGTLTQIKATDKVDPDIEIVQVVKPYHHVLASTAVYYIPGTDSCLFYCSSNQPGRDITGHFVRSSHVHLAAGYSATSLRRLNSEMVNRPLVLDEHMTSPRYFTVERTGFKTQNGFLCQGTTEAGTSGSPVVVFNPHIPNKLMGFISNATSASFYVDVVTHEDLISALTQYETLPLPSPGHNIIMNVDLDHNIECSAFSSTHPVGLVGPEEIIPLSSGLGYAKTPFYHDFPCSLEPAITHNHDRRKNTDKHFLAHSIEKFTRDETFPLPPEHLAISIIAHSFELASHPTTEHCKVVTFEEAIQGSGDPGSSKLDLLKSPGFPYCLKRRTRGKTTWIRRGEDGEICYIDDVLREHHADRLEQYKLGQVPDSIMYDFAKCELRPNYKINKTRSIQVMNMLDTIIFRQYFLSLEAAIHRLGTSTYPSKIGVDPGSFTWTLMYRALTSKGPYIIDLDVSGWDANFPSTLMYGVVEMFDSVYEDTSYVDSKVRVALATNALYGVCQYDNYRYRKNRGMPSGFAGTAIFNTLGHMLLFYVFYRELCIISGNKDQIHFDNYRNNVCTFFYGDDLIASIHESIISWFNGVTIAERYNNYGWRVTMAAKDGEDIVMYKSITQATFLKRGWIKDPMLELYYAPIALETLYSLLVWRSTRQPEFVQIDENICNALDFAAHWGQSFFNELKARLNLLIRKHHLQNHIRPITIDFTDVRDQILCKHFPTHSFQY